MQRHTKIYMDAMGYDVSDFIPCECCGAGSVDINHIESRGMGGNPSGDKDVIENLQALCRNCHETFGSKKQHMEYLRARHKQVMVERLKK